MRESGARTGDSLTDAAATQMVKMFGRDQSRLGVLYFNVIHDNEMYIGEPPSVFGPSVFAFEQITSWL